MLPALSNQCSPLVTAMVLFEGWRDALARIWYYLSHKYAIGNLEGSVTSLVGGVLVFALALLLSRTLSKLLQRRIAKKAYLDPGLHYTIGRLTQYLVIAVGLLLALSFGVGLNLTSIAVLFTALSVGIGFGLQYIAADIASGFILLFERPVRVGDRITIGEDEGVRLFALRAQCGRDVRVPSKTEPLTCVRTTPAASRELLPGQIKARTHGLRILGCGFAFLRRSHGSQSQP